jgi:segregation and condensation protein A
VIRLFDQQRSRRAMICLFLAILELVKRRSVELVQEHLFGDIAIRRGYRFHEPHDAEEYAEVAEEYQ